MNPVEWLVAPSAVDYERAVAFMEQRVAAIQRGDAPGLIWLVEHPALYTAGTSAKETDLLQARFPVHISGRGGQFTYHGPGQRVAYVMLDLKQVFAPNPPDLRAYIQRLEHWIMAALETFGIKGFTCAGRVGIWVNDRTTHALPAESEKKIAAIGVRVRSWVCYHGVAINVQPDLSHYSGIIPCGIQRYGVTSMHEQGVHIPLEALDDALKQHLAVLMHG